MQQRLQKTLGEQKHLADLGLAVSKINHDMRNILASAQLLSDRLRDGQRPVRPGLRAEAAARARPRRLLFRGRARLWPHPGGAAVAPPPAARQLVDEVQDLLGIDPAGGIEFVNAVEPGFEVDADSEQLFRVLTNLSPQRRPGDGRRRASAPWCGGLTISAERSGSVSRILVTDTGPGLPQKARDNLFAAFRGSARSGGTGLGLAIAHELVRAHGGSLELVESIGGRTVFAVTIPDQPVRLDEARSALRRPA